MGEALKFLPNGQWSLEKNWTPKHIKAVDQWGSTGLRQHLDKIPPATGPLRHRMLTTLNQHGDTRVNPKTSQKEYKLYRAANIDDDSHNKQVTSWTPNLKVAHEYTNTLDTGDKKRKLLHAWIPEEHIHSYLPPIQKKFNMTHGPGDDDISNEQEVLIHPHKISIHKIQHGAALDKENKKHGIGKHDPWGSLNSMGLTLEQSKARHGKPHPSHPGRIWNHSTPSETGYHDLPGYSYNLEGDNFVGRKNGKIVYSEPL